MRIIKNKAIIIDERWLLLLKRRCLSGKEQYINKVKCVIGLYALLQLSCRQYNYDGRGRDDFMSRRHR